MFDLTSSKLLLLGIVALLVIGPKDFPALLRTIGKYVGIIRGHAKEFRAQFDEAMRESELADLKKDVENIARETEASLQATGQTVESSLNEARQSIDTSIDTAAKPPPDPFAHDADGIPIAPPPAIETSNLNGSHAGEAPADTAGEPVTHAAEEPRRPAEKSGA
jgi:sec-independent protein translocase protein TatB